MRRIIVFNRIAVDGSFAAADGNLNWVVAEPEIDRAAVGSMPGTDAILFGRKTFQMFESFWRNFDASTASNPHGQPSDAMPEMARWINEASKIVFSTTLSEATWRNTRLLRELDPREIAAIKSGPGKDIMLFGSGSIVSQLTRLGLIDDYQFVVNPTILGDGRRLFDEAAGSRSLKLVEAKSLASGIVQLRYVPAH